MGTKRKSAIIQPELASVYMCEELLWIDKRKTTPHKISWPDRYQPLKKVIPYWLFKIIRRWIPFVRAEQGV